MEELFTCRICNRTKHVDQRVMTYSREDGRLPGWLAEVFVCGSCFYKLPTEEIIEQANRHLDIIIATRLAQQACRRRDEAVYRLAKI
jgi:hypothetical protein